MYLFSKQGINVSSVKITFIHHKCKGSERLKSCLENVYKGNVFTSRLSKFKLKSCWTYWIYYWIINYDHFLIKAWQENRRIKIFCDDKTRVKRLWRTYTQRSLLHSFVQQIWGLFKIITKADPAEINCSKCAKEAKFNNLSSLSAFRGVNYSATFEA